MRRRNKYHDSLPPKTEPPVTHARPLVHVVLSSGRNRNLDFSCFVKSNPARRELARALADALRDDDNLAGSTKANTYFRLRAFNRFLDWRRGAGIPGTREIRGPRDITDAVLYEYQAYLATQPRTMKSAHDRYSALVTVLKRLQVWKPELLSPDCSFPRWPRGVAHAVRQDVLGIKTLRSILAAAIAELDGVRVAHRRACELLDASKGFQVQIVRTAAPWDFWTDPARAFHAIVRGVGIDKPLPKPLWTGFLARQSPPVGAFSEVTPRLFREFLAHVDARRARPVLPRTALRSCWSLQLLSLGRGASQDRLAFDPVKVGLVVVGTGRRTTQAATRCIAEPVLAKYLTTAIRVIDERHAALAEVRILARRAPVALRASTRMQLSGAQRNGLAPTTAADARAARALTRFERGHLRYLPEGAELTHNNIAIEARVSRFFLYHRPPLLRRFRELQRTLRPFPPTAGPVCPRFNDLQVACFIIIAISTGMRLSEMLAIERGVAVILGNVPLTPCPERVSRGRRRGLPTPKSRNHSLF